MRNRLIAAVLAVVMLGIVAAVLAGRAGRKPDLTFADVTINYADSTFSWTLMNLGSRDADPGGRRDGPDDNLLIQAILSDHDRAKADTSDLVVARYRLRDADRVPSLESLSGTIPLQPGGRLCEFDYLKVYVDRDDDLKESDERNNLLVVPVDCEPLPDLAVTQVDIDYAAGSYRWTVQNVGVRPANLDGEAHDPSDNLEIQGFLSDRPALTGSVHGAGRAVVGESP